MKFIITQQTFKDGKLISTYKRQCNSCVHANFDAHELAEKLEKRKDLSDWSVKIHDEDGNEYTHISPTVGDKCTALYVAIMMEEVTRMKRALLAMGLDVVNELIEGMTNGKGMDEEIED